MCAQSTERDAWAAALDGVLRDRARVHVAFEPLVDLRTGELRGHVARPSFPEAPGVPVRAWTEAAARLGLGGALGAVLLEAALDVPPLPAPAGVLVVGLSPVAVASAEVDAVLRARSRPGSLALALLDRGEAAHPSALRAALAELRARSVGLAVAEVGRRAGGYARVAEVHPQLVELDVGLVAGATADPARAELVAVVAELAERVGALPAAAGVDDVVALDLLRARGVVLGRGALLGPPAPQAGLLDPEVVALVRRRARAAPGA